VADEYIRRAAITRLNVSQEQATLIEDTISEWKNGCDIASGIGWDEYEHDPYTLQSLAESDVREHTRLKSQHAILATHQAANALSGVHELHENNQQVSKPRFTSPTIKYDANTMTVFDDYTVSLTTTESRVRCEMVLPEEEDGFQYEFLEDGDWELATSTLTARDGEYFLHIGFRRDTPLEDEESPAEDRTVLGVDLGINNIAVTSTAHFESGKKLVHERDCFERIRGGLQETGTQSAHRTLVGLKGREERYYRDKLHRVANAIIAEAVAHNCTHIVFENLKYIRKNISNGKRFQQWAHRNLVSFVEYKAEERGIRVDFVNPRYTSQRCSECGHTSTGNRSNEEFECERCGKKLHADYNAAKNIGWRFVRRGLNDPRRTGDSQLTLKSGTVKPNRGFAPYPSGVEAESTGNVEATGHPTRGR